MHFFTRIAQGLFMASLFSMLISATHAGKPGEWEQISEEDGITVWRMDIPGKDWPAFRGETTINASIDAIVSVLRDNTQHTNWMYRCVESAMLEEISDSHAVVYTRIDAPWPTWDRDVVLDTVVQKSDDGKQLTMQFNAIDGRNYRPIPEKTVRMPRMVGGYTLTEAAPGKTHVRYEAESDIGGRIPKWMAEIGAKDLPHITLSRLRSQVKKVSDK